MALILNILFMVCPAVFEQWLRVPMAAACSNAANVRVSWARWASRSPSPSCPWCAQLRVLQLSAAAQVHVCFVAACADAAGKHVTGASSASRDQLAAC